MGRDIICEDTRFLLATHLSETRHTRDAQILMERAAKRAGKASNLVIADKLRSYLDGTEKAFGADSEHIQSGPFKFAVKHSKTGVAILSGELPRRLRKRRYVAPVPVCSASGRALAHLKPTRLAASISHKCYLPVFCSRGGHHPHKLSVPH